MERREIAVIGGGLAGTATALALAKAGFDTVLVAPDAPADRRSTALIGRSVAFLSDLGIFEALGSKAEPLAVMRLIDDTRRLLRAPTVEFRASEIGLSAFGYNVLNSDLLAALQAQAANAPQLERRDTAARSYRIEGERAVVELADGGSLAVDLVVAADGRRSPMREAAGIGLREWSYPQSAIVLNFGHRIDHQSISTEFHTRSGPFTQVPLPGRHSSLVWVEEPKLAELYAELAPDKLSRMIEDRMQSILGEVTVEEPIQRFPLSGASVDRFTGDRLALVGEAAHVFPPIGAQGLNLGLRDCEDIVRLACESRDDPGARVTLLRYDASRRSDVARAPSASIFSTGRCWRISCRARWRARSGLARMRALPLLRQFAMREGLSPGAGLTGMPRSAAGNGSVGHET